MTITLLMSVCMVYGDDYTYGGMEMTLGASRLRVVKITIWKMTVSYRHRLWFTWYKYLALHTYMYLVLGVY